MYLSNFDDLLNAARQQTSVQRLLLVFATTELPTDATPEQRAGFARGEGGALTPAMCVDKSPAEVADFLSLKTEANQFVLPWRLVFASTLSGSATEPPGSEQVESALQRMVESIKLGAFANMIAFDVEGEIVTLD